MLFDAGFFLVIFSNGIAYLCLEPIACYEKVGSEPNQAVVIQFS